MTVPEPMTPPDCDLRDFAFMPLDVLRLRDSGAAALPDPEAFRACVLAWCVSWHQVPAASLPDDDAALSVLLGYGRTVAAWLKVRKAGGLHGWVKCADGRLYHPTVAEKAMESWARKKAQQERSKKGNAARWGGGGLPQTPSHKEPEPVLRGSADSPKRIDAASLEENKTVPQGLPADPNRQGQGEGKGSLRSPPRARACQADPDFAAFYDCYPRHEAPDDALKAWRQVTAAGAQAADLMAGLRRFRFNADPRYIPLPASWLRAGRWKDEPPAPMRMPPPPQHRENPGDRRRRVLGVPSILDFDPDFDNDPQRSLDHDPRH